MAAIYQWFVSGEFLFTTTIYPIEALDQLNWAAEVTGGGTNGIAFDYSRFAVLPLDGALDRIWYESGVSVDAAAFGVLPLDSELDQIWFQTGVPVDNTQFGAIPLDSTMDLALVTHDVQPYEALDLAAWVTGGGTF